MGTSEKRHCRTPSLSRCSSFFSCFNGGQESYEPISTTLSGQTVSGRSKKPPTLQLGSKGPPKRNLSFNCRNKVREACEQALEVAKKGSPHISELFVGGQLFMQVTPAKFGPKAHKQSISPSIGFLHMATTATTNTIETPNHER